MHIIRRAEIRQDLSRGRAYFLDLARIKEYHIFDFTGGFAVGVTAEG